MPGGLLVQISGPAGLICVGKVRDSVCPTTALEPLKEKFIFLPIEPYHRVRYNHIQ